MTTEELEALDVRIASARTRLIEGVLPPQVARAVLVVLEVGSDIEADVLAREVLSLPRLVSDSATVDRVAKAMARDTFTVEWAALTEDHRHAFRIQARSAIEAMRGSSDA